METKRLRKYSGITLGVVLVTAFVLVQPVMQTVYAVGIEGLPDYDDCELDTLHEDPISMNTVRSKSIVKTIHAEKEIFHCFLNQGNLPVIVDVTTYLEIYENIDDREVIETNAVATTCLKDQDTATVIDCESYDIPSIPVPVGSVCEEEDFEITHPQEMNTVNKGNTAKTVEAQKEVFTCNLPPECNDEEDQCVEKKVDIVLFTEIYEDLTTQTILDVQFLSARCVVLESDAGGDLQDGSVESCTFTQIEN